MKKYLIFALAILFLLALAGCAGGTASPPAVTSEPTATPELTPEPEPTTTEEPAPDEDTFTIEQLERAMYPQWNFGGEPDILGHHIISAERVERESDYVWFEPAGAYVDASNAVRYRLEIRHRDMWLDVHDLGNGFVEAEQIIGDYVISIRYIDFITVNGEPELLFLVC